MKYLKETMLIILWIIAIFSLSCKDIPDPHGHDNPYDPKNPNYEEPTVANQVIKPIFTPSAGSYSSAQGVTISTATADATIRYTTDSSTPTSEYGNIYSTAIQVKFTTVIKAIAYKTDMENSEVAEATFTISGTISTPAFTPDPDTYTTAQKISIAVVPTDANIRYRTDGIAPTSTTGTVYGGVPIQIKETTTIKAIAYKDGCTDSEIATALYKICPAVPANVKATDGTHTDKVVITWDVVAFAEGYNVFRSVCTNGKYSKIGTATTASYEDTNTTPSIKYFYKISATNKDCTETEQSDSNDGYAAVSGAFGNNTMVNIPATNKYDGTTACVSESEFYLGGTGGPPEVQVALNTFSINKYEVTNEEFQRNFYDLNGDGTLDSDSAYTTSSLVGPAGITAKEAWERAMDLNEDGTYPDRSVAFSASGVTLGTTGNDLDYNNNTTYANFKGPGADLATTQTTYWNESSTPWTANTNYSDISNTTNTPVIFVSWYEARAYCKYVYGTKGDLPTEAQWERAAKGTTSTAYQYPWGTTPPNCTYANYNPGTACEGKTTNVGTHPTGKTAWKTGIELFDMAGNTYEWGLTWYVTAGDYPTAYGSEWSTTNPSKKSRLSCDERIVRGGSLYGDSASLQSSDRNCRKPHSRALFTGFRCVINE